MTPAVGASIRGKRDRRAKTAIRGYGGRHPLIRRVVARSVAAGVAVCWRCRLPIVPGEPWDLGHVDGDKTRYAGAEHRRCNRATASRQRRKTSRAW